MVTTRLANAGAAGALGVTALDGAEDGPSPVEFVARTVNV
jgi:hypothetical protein